MLDFYDLVIIGGGPAGLAAALAARENGLEKILIAERDNCLGGILNQCIHNGFGLHYFKEELTGPEYAGRFIKKLADSGIDCVLDTMVLELSGDKSVKILNKSEGYRSISAKSVIIATGCRERTRGAIAVPGERPAGIFTAGTAQRYVNIEGFMPGRKVLILGSGDIGLIMARRMTLEGAKVVACVELMPYSGGLTRNIVQCLEDYDIPLYLSHTLIDIQGKNRVERVIAAQVDQNRKSIPGTEKIFDCDTVLLSVGLIPENELSRGASIEIDPRTNGAFVYENMESSVPGVFACGNAVHVHDLADFVTEEGFRAGKAAANYVQNGAKTSGGFVSVKNGDGVSYTVPQRIRTEALENKTDLFFRVNRIFGKSEIIVHDGKDIIKSYRREHMAPGEMERITLPPCTAGGFIIEAREV